MAGPPQAPCNYDAIETELLGSHVLLTRMRGHVTRALAERQLGQFRELLELTHAPCWIIEQVEVTDFEPSAVTAQAEWFSAFKDWGGKRVITVTPLAAARMVTASLAFAVHAPVASCETLKEAYELAGVGPVELRPSLVTLSPPKRSGASLAPKQRR